MKNSLDLPGDPKDSRIVVAMSGGVDSSVVAGLLAREGYDVVGMTLQLYDHGEAIHRKGACCAGQDIHDLRKLLDDWRSCKRTVFTTLIKAVTMGVLGFIAATVWLKIGD